jgi:hypothetical protein
MRAASYFFLLLCVALPVVAEDEPAIEKHKVGQFNITSGGAPAKIYLQAAHDYGAKVDPSMVSKARKGELKWFVDKGTQGVTYQVTVPKSYEPGQPHGVVVFVNSSDGGALPGSIKQHLEKYRLIGIAAQKSGNEREVLLRHAYAVHAVELLNERYDLDPDRIYISGTSGGGRLCSQAMIMNSDVFTGGFPLVGANACITMKVADSKGNSGMAPGVWQNLDKSRFAKAGREGRFVFMTGSKDYNQANVKSVYEGYQKAGFKYVEYIEQPGLGHGVPNAEHIEKALQFLDSPLTEAAHAHYEDAKKQQEKGRLGEALVLYRKASLHGRNADWNADAVAQTQTLQAQYEAAYGVAEAAIASQDNTAFRKATQELRRTWGEVADRDVIKDLTNRFRDAG